MEKYEYDPEFIGNLLDAVDDFLEERGIRLPQSEKEKQENFEPEDNHAVLYGSDYDDLSDRITGVLDQWHGMDIVKEDDYER